MITRNDLTGNSLFFYYYQGRIVSLKFMYKIKGRKMFRFMDRSRYKPVTIKEKDFRLLFKESRDLIREVSEMWAECLRLELSLGDNVTSYDPDTGMMGAVQRYQHLEIENA